MDSLNFTEDTFDFLNSLSENNHRDWFTKNKQRYEEFVRIPALNFITRISHDLHTLSPHFMAVPKKVGGSLMRVYRDTRFSKDKTPYKTNIGIQFRHELGKDVHAPGYYVHIQSGECFLGAGIWHPDSPTLGEIRTTISKKQNQWIALQKDKKFKSSFYLSGDSLKNPPRGYSADHPLINDIKRKDFIAVKEISHSEVLSADFHRKVLQNFKITSEFMRFLCESLNVNF